MCSPIDDLILFYFYFFLSSDRFIFCFLFFSVLCMLLMFYNCIHSKLSQAFLRYKLNLKVRKPFNCYLNKTQLWYFWYVNKCCQESKLIIVEKVFLTSTPTNRTSNIIFIGWDQNKYRYCKHDVNVHVVSVPLQPHKAVWAFSNSAHSWSVCLVSCSSVLSSCIIAVLGSQATTSHVRHSHSDNSPLSFLSS